MSHYDYDLLVIGSDPAGHRAAIQAAKLDKRVAIIEKRTVLGGVCLNTGTIPSKTLREAALRLSGYREPGISMVGKTEEQLTGEGVHYEVGRAQYREIARGQILGDRTGLLKLIFHREDRQLLGVHIIGAEAAELVHIGQAVLGLGGKIDYFVDTVFNYPTLAECYKTAAFDGINRLGLS